LVNENDSFSIIILPDTQYYSLKDGKNGFPNTYSMQTQWIADNAISENIQFVIHMGDMTNKNTINEWKVADDAHKILDDADIAYSVIPGNHDYPGDGNVDSGNSELYNQYFGRARFSDKSWYGGSYKNSNDNNYCFFNYKNIKFLIISLEFAPTKKILCWADQLISSYPDHNIILATHCYSRTDNSHNEICNTYYDVVGSSGDDIWNELARRHSNILFVLSGHVPRVGYKTRAGNNGNCVHEILTDYQFEEWEGERYGNGWMRKLVFNPNEGTVNVESFTVLPNVNEFNYQGGTHGYNSNPEHSDHKFVIENIYLTPSYSRTQLSNTFNDLTVNVEYTGDQLKPEIASASSGDFVVVWEDDKDNNGHYQLYARGFYVDGCEKFAPIVVNQIPDGQQLKPHIDMAPDGKFVVVWEDDQDRNGKYQILAAGFNEYGKRRFNDVTVNAISEGQQYKPRVGLQNNGNFIVTWEDDKDGNGKYQILATIFEVNGKTKVVNDFTVNKIADGQQFKPDVAVSSNGNYIITWEDDQDGNGKYQILATGFYPNSKNKIFQDITVNKVSTGQQYRPKVDIDQNGSFTVVWADNNNNNAFYQILAANFNSSGQRIGSDIVVKPDFNKKLFEPDISKSNLGSYIITWQDDADGNGKYQIRAKGYKSDNSILFKERTINEDENGDQLKPVVSLVDKRSYIISWEDDLDNNGKWQILANGHDLEASSPPNIDCSLGCVSELNLSGSQSVDRLFKAESYINSSAVSSANITYQAGGSVSLDNGFTTIPNKDFLVEIVECSQSSEGNSAMYKINNDGKVGSEIDERNWRKTWEVIFPYKVNENNYLLFYDNGLATMYNINNDGKVGSKIDERNWRETWDIIFPYEVNGNSYLMFYDSGLAAMYSINDDGKVGSKIDERNWRETWDIIFPYEVNGNSYLMFYDSGLAAMYSINNDGKVGSKIDERNWRETWDIIFPYSVNGKNYLFFYDSGWGAMYEINNDGKVGLKIDERTNWRESWYIIFPYNLNGKNYILFYDSGFGAMYEINDDGKVGLKIDERTNWRKTWDMIFPYSTNANDFLLFYGNEII